MEATLTRLLRPKAVPMETLHRRYGALLELVRRLIGVVPNCDSYLEIWPPGFRTYNVMVPSFLNLPLGIWGGGAPKEVVGLALYASSRAAECAYCSAHTCSFALRRGAMPDKVARALDGASGLHTPAEQAVLAVARSLSRVPCAVTDAEREALRRHFPPGEVEWIVLGVAMMGFLNKFMDGVGVELESSTADEVSALIGPSGWSPGKHAADGEPKAGPPPRRDTLATKLSILPYVPAALSLDRKWTAGVPNRWPAAGELLREKTGHDFPVLSRLRHRGPIRAIATMVRDNFDASNTVLGLATKKRAGLIYAETIGNAALAAELGQLEVKDGSAPNETALVLARALSPSPAQISAELVDRCAELDPAAIVELVVFLSVLQMLHRLSSFYPDAR